MLEVGVRVARGPDWKWGQQDDGEGHVGTVVEIGKPGSSTSPDKTVVVQWDSGSRTNYRVGYQGAYDLRVVDNAPAGVKHPNIICDGCKKHGIAGMRWKCARCYDYDLCTHCYMSDKHDLVHLFQRFETASSIGVEMGPRKGCAKVQMTGIFVGAKVVRGPDWDWSNQDGGEGKTGRVIDIRGWDNESGRSVANVTWTSGSTNVYRLGHKGKVDLKYVQDAVGGYYYRDHLPILGITSEVQGGAARQCGSSPRHLTFNVGDKVKVLMDVEALKQMQEGHGGWNPRMAEYVGKMGIVHRVTERGDIRVQYEGCNNRWTFHPGALTKVNTFAVGDVVRVKHDLATVRDYQKGHGEWIEVMKGALGKLGKVIKIYSDGDLRVSIDGQTWTFNPLCVQLVPGSATELSNTMNANTREEHASSHDSDYEECDLLGCYDLYSGRSLPAFQRNVLSPSSESKSTACSTLKVKAVHSSEMSVNFYQAVRCNIPEENPLASLLSNLVLGSQQLETTSLDKLVREAAQGHLDVVREFVLKYPDKVDGRSGGKTCLQVACHQGHVELVQFLLSVGASLEVADDDGDTALHYSAFGNQPEIMEILLKQNADIDAVNKGRCSALHVAVNKQHMHCVVMLLKYKCNVNIQDSYGDTALHDAIGKDSVEIIDLLCNVPGVDFTLKNKRGFNVLHHAALKGNNFATERLLGRTRQLVDVKKDDGFAALHLACLNGHRAVAETLLAQGQAEVDLRNNRKQTPLLLAVSQGHCSVVELVVSMSADVHAEDEDGDTGLHLALMKRATISTEINELEAPTIYGIFMQLASRTVEHLVALAIACYLVQEGCKLNKKNNKGKSPLDLVQDTVMVDLLQQYVTPRSVANEPLARSLTVDSESSVQSDSDGSNTSVGEKRAPAPVECAVCSELGEENVLFEPCGHRIACEDCSARMKKCLRCGQFITKRLTQGLYLAV